LKVPLKKAARPLGNGKYSLLKFDFEKLGERPPERDDFEFVVPNGVTIVNTIPEFKSVKEFNALDITYAHLIKYRPQK
jgi:hypothetical protein